MNSDLLKGMWRGEWAGERAGILNRLCCSTGLRQNYNRQLVVLKVGKGRKGRIARQKKPQRPGGGVGLRGAKPPKRFLEVLILKSFRKVN